MLSSSRAPSLSAFVIPGQAAQPRRPRDPAARSRQRSRNLSAAPCQTVSRYRAPLGPPVSHPLTRALAEG